MGYTLGPILNAYLALPNGGQVVMMAMGAMMGLLGIPVPGAAVGAQYINALVGGGEGELDSSAIYKIMKKLNA